MTGTDDGDRSPSLGARVRAGAGAFAARWRALGDALGRSARRSRIGDVARRVETGARRSRVVRWLTSEPQPDVVVIDLAATRTVGPVLRVLDGLVGAIGRAGRSTGLSATATNAASVLQRNAVPAASGALLGSVLVTLALGWPTWEPLWLVALAIAGVAGLLGLGVDRSPQVLADSTVRQWLVALFAPPGDDAREGTR